jgi:hypothetical protein
MAIPQPRAEKMVSLFAALRVLNDMQDRGVPLSASILSTSVALQARHSEPEAALRMLDVIYL